ncbi:hypothetical protein ACTFIW_000952 [Dictyostelium discoideum]
MQHGLESREISATAIDGRTERSPVSSWDVSSVALKAEIFSFVSLDSSTHSSAIFFSKESKEKNKKTLSDELLKEFNLKKGFQCENIVDIPIERHYSTPIDVEKVKATTDIPIHSDNYNLNICSFHLYSNVRDKELSLVLYQI